MSVLQRVQPAQNETNVKVKLGRCAGRFKENRQAGNHDDGAVMLGQHGQPQDGDRVRGALRAAARQDGRQADHPLPEGPEERRRGRGGGEIPDQHGRSGVCYFLQS